MLIFILWTVLVVFIPAVVVCVKEFVVISEPVSIIRLFKITSTFFFDVVHDVVKTAFEVNEQIRGFF